jgi:hypothetical protein
LVEGKAKGEGKRSEGGLKLHSKQTFPSKLTAQREFQQIHSKEKGKAKKREERKQEFRRPHNQASH